MSKVLPYLGGAFAVGYGGYFVMQYQDVSKLEKEQQQFQHMVDSETKRIATSKKVVTESEAKLNELQQKERAEGKAVSEVCTKLEAARKEVQRLEGEYKQKSESLKKVKEDIATNTRKIDDMRADMERAKEALTLGEKSLKLARQQVADAKKMFNPLNHPKVKQVLGK